MNDNPEIRAKKSSISVRKFSIGVPSQWRIYTEYFKMFKNFC